MTCLEAYLYLAILEAKIVAISQEIRMNIFVDFLYFTKKMFNFANI